MEESTVRYDSGKMCHYETASNMIGPSVLTIFYRLTSIVLVLRALFSFIVVLPAVRFILSAALLFLPFRSHALLTEMWEAGRLDYSYGGAEVAAFVNTREQIQLQVVLCSRQQPYAYRLSVLLPHEHSASGIMPVNLNVDGTVTHVYAEVQGNSLEFQVGANFLITLPDSPNFEMEFTRDDALFLKIPQVISFSMSNANLVLSEVARSCVTLSNEHNFSSNQQLLSGILWPRHGFNRHHDSEVDRRAVISGNMKPSTGKADNVIASASPSGSSSDSSVSTGSKPHNNGADATGAATAAGVSAGTAAGSEAGAAQSAAASGQGAAGAVKAGRAESMGGRDHPVSVAQRGSAGGGSSSDDDETYRDIDSLCLRYNYESKIERPVVNGLVSSIDSVNEMPLFVLTDKCRAALDDIYEAHGKQALSFLPEFFKDPTGHYQRYVMLWNNVLLDTSRMDFKHPDRHLDDFDYYLTLFSLFSDTRIRQYPQSYYDILKLKEDPSTFLYTMDNRYELETVKYASVLSRRLTGFLSPQQNASEAISAWHNFYQELSSALPPISKAQAIRPVLYRQMLMRIWRLAGYPESLHLRPKYAFVQGTNGKTTTREPLEARCSVFEGSNGDQFFFASSDCVRSISTDLRNLGMINQEYQEVLNNWDRFAREWTASVFYSDDAQDAVGEHLRSGFALTMLSLYKNYGFGDYFLLRKCISSRDSDICAYEANTYYESYYSDLRKTVASIASVSSQDARELKRLNDLWVKYYESLKTYTRNLAQRNKIPLWRAAFVQGVAVTSQSEAILNSLYFSQAFAGSRSSLPTDDF